MGAHPSVSEQVETIRRVAERDGMWAEGPGYEGPVLPGSRWRSKGTAGHQRDFPVTVLKLTTAGRVVFVRHRAGNATNGERRLTMDEAAFRQTYVLDKLPASMKTLKALAYCAVVRAGGQGLIDEVGWEQERRMTRVAEDLTPEPAAPPAAVEPEPEAPLTDPEAVTAEAVALGKELTADPLEAFLAHGRATVEQLDADLLRVEEDRELARLELEELDARLAAMRFQRERVQQAISAAIAVATAPEEPAALVPPPVPAVPAPEPEPVLTPAAPTQRDWMRARFAERKLWAVRDLLPAFMETFGGDRARATQNVSSILTEWVKHHPKGMPQVIRVSQGLYEAVD